MQIVVCTRFQWMRSLTTPAVSVARHDVDEESQSLTTFISPSGRYCYKGLPCEISSAPKFVEKRMAKVFLDFPGVICMIDDM